MLEEGITLHPTFSTNTVQAVVAHLRLLCARPAKPLRSIQTWRPLNHGRNMVGMSDRLRELRSELSETFGKLTRFRNEVVENCGSLDAPAADQIPIAERILAEQPRGVAGYVYECLRKDRPEGRVDPNDE
jgi:hypothetical protein